MNKLKALEAFDDQDGSFAAGDEFHVNDERAFVLLRTRPVERVVEQPVVVDASTDSASAGPQYGVPRQREDA